MSQGFTTPLPVPLPVAKGGTGLVSTTINQLLYSSAANTIAGLATGNSSVLVTSAGGVPSLSTALPSGLTATNMALTTPTLGVAIATSLTFSPTTNGIVGTTTNNNVVAGSVGEFVSSAILSSSSVSTTTSTATNLTSISLTAGDWDVWGNVTFTVSVGASIIANWISSTSATIPDANVIGKQQNLTANIGTGGKNAPERRFSLSTTTTIYITGYAIFPSGTVTLCGGIYARRVR